MYSNKFFYFYVYGQISQKYKIFISYFYTKQKLKKNICLSMLLDFNNQLIKVVRPKLIFQK
jgi:hypothetical protein